MKLFNWCEGISKKYTWALLIAVVLIIVSVFATWMPYVASYVKSADTNDLLRSIVALLCLNIWINAFK